MMKVNLTLICLLFVPLFGCQQNKSVELINSENIIGEWRYIVEYGKSEVVLSFNDSTVYDCFYINDKISYKGAEQYTYSIQGESLIINYDYRDSEYKILKLTEDSLILQTSPIIDSGNYDNSDIDDSIEKYYRLK